MRTNCNNKNTRFQTYLPKMSLNLGSSSIWNLSMYSYSSSVPRTLAILTNCEREHWMPLVTTWSQFCVGQNFLKAHPNFALLFRCKTKSSEVGQFQKDVLNAHEIKQSIKVLLVWIRSNKQKILKRKRKAYKIQPQQSGIQVQQTKIVFVLICWRFFVHGEIASTLQNSRSDRTISSLEHVRKILTFCRFALFHEEYVPIIPHWKFTQSTWS